MKVKFWGTRGSIAAAGHDTLRYGGNTSCVEIRSDDGSVVVVDCGTGARALGASLMAEAAGKPLDGHVLITHTHWDHIQGLPFFAPLFVEGNRWDIYGPRGLGDSIADTLSGQMNYTYFPVSLEQLGASIRYHDLVEGTFTVDGLTISTHYLNHPALTLGFRLEADGRSVVYSSDHEPHDPGLAAGGKVEASRHDALHVNFLRDADVVIHDAQYLAEEYAGKKGWGHSTVEYVVDVARAANVRHLVLFHHDPARTDDQVDAVIELAQRHAESVGYEGRITAAAEGEEIVVEGVRTEPSARTEAAKPAVFATPLDDEYRTALFAVHDDEIAAGLTAAAAQEKVDAAVISDPELAVEYAAARRPSLVVIEQNRPDRSGIDIHQRLQKLGAELDDEFGIVVVARGSADTLEASPLDITDWLWWPASEVYVRTKLRAWMLRRACRWQPAPLPPDEDQRLASLRSLDILDTDPEERFDIVTREASEMFGVPIALVSLVDSDRQWFKSRHGIDAIETPREMAFCAHAIHDDEVFHVADAMADPRFADNPLVADDPRVRFYAGVPLKLSDGSRAGTLCVIDHRPRELSSDQLDQLKAMGKRVEAELEAD